MKTFLLVSSLLAVSLAVPIANFNKEWFKFKATYQKDYRTETEENLRKDIFMSNCRIINAHNELYEKGLVTYKMGIRKFADLRSEEFAALIGGWNPSNLQANYEFRDYKDFTNESIDWRDYGVVTEVKDQGHCRSCWAFSTTGSLEGQVALQNGSKLYSLSEQQLLDCSSAYGNDGCLGGAIDNAFNYVINITGINQEQDYPYETKQSACRATDTNTIATPPVFTVIKSNDDNALDFFVSYVGPISSSIAINNTLLHLYAEGVYSQPDNGVGYDIHRHNVLVIGFGKTEDNGYYWLIKDSLGTDFGDGGYWKLPRHANNALGIGSTLVFPLFGEL